MDLLKEGKEKEIIQETGLTVNLLINFEQKIFKVYKIKLSHLFFNDKNDRIITFINQYKHVNNVNAFDRTDLEKYNNILHDFIVQSNKPAFEKTKKNILTVGGQLKHGVVLRDGRIIDGNRRFTCLRELAKINPKFEYFNAVILEESIENNERIIKMLELNLQQGEDEKVGYDPIDKLAGIYNDIVKNGLLNEQDYAKSIGQSENYIKKEVEISKLVADYLKFLGEEDKFYLAREFKIDGPIREIHRLLKPIDDYAKNASAKYLLFSILSSNDSGDLTREIRKFGKVFQSRYFDNYINENDNNVENILTLYKDKTKNIKEKREQAVLSQDAKNIKNSYELIINKINSELSKDEPIKLLNKAYDVIEGIDYNIFVKLSTEEQKNVFKSFSKIEQLCENLKGKLRCSED